MLCAGCGVVMWVLCVSYVVVACYVVVMCWICGGCVLYGGYVEVMCWLIMIMVMIIFIHKKDTLQIIVTNKQQSPNLRMLVESYTKLI